MITIDQSGFDEHGTVSAFTATGGVPPYAFSVSAGAMPAGLKLASDGGVCGVTLGGSFEFTIRATNSKLIPEYGERHYLGTLSGGHSIPILHP